MSLPPKNRAIAKGTRHARLSREAGTAASTLPRDVAAKER